MKIRIVLTLLVLSSLAFSQTPAYPSQVVTDTQLKVAVNRLSTVLTAPIGGPSDTSITVQTTAGWAPNLLATIDSEIIAICGVSGNTLLVGNSTGSCPNVNGRGFDGTTPASHLVGPCNSTSQTGCVSRFLVAWDINALRKEVEAVEATLGANLSNIPSGANALGSYWTSRSTNGPANQVNLGALASGLLKNTVSGGVSTPSIAANSDIIGLWTGSCTSSTFLRGDGTCQNPAGGVTSVFGQTGAIANLSGDATTAGSSAVTVKGINGVALSGLTTGLLKNTTGTGAPSIAATADIIGLFTGCSGTQYLGADGACHTPSGSGLGDPGLNGILKRTSLNVTGIAASADIIGLFSGCSGTQYLGADGTCHSPVGTGTVTVTGGMTVNSILTSAGTAGTVIQAANAAATLTAAGDISTPGGLSTGVGSGKTAYAEFFGVTSGGQGFTVADAAGSPTLYVLPSAVSSGAFLKDGGVVTCPTLASGAPTACESLVWANPAGNGTVTTSGSPLSGALAKFSGATVITSGDLTGDITTSGTLTATLASVNSNVGACGDATHVCQATFDGKGRATAATAVLITGGGGGGGTGITQSAVVFPTYQAPIVPLGLAILAPVTVANTLTPTSLLSNFYGSNLVRAGDWIGRTFRIRASGAYGSTSSPTLTVTVKLGGVTLATFTPTILSSTSNDGWRLDYEFTVSSMTAGNGSGCFASQGTSGAMIGACTGGSTTGLNFAADQVLDVVAAWSAASASNTITADIAVVQ